MRAACLFLMVALVGVRAAAADDKPAEAPKRSKVEVAADAVRDAVRAANPDALRALAEKDKPDPWLVADELCYRGEHAAAEAFAKAATRPDVEMLAEYVRAWRTRAPDQEERERLQAMDAALERSDFQEVVQRTGPAEAAIATILEVQLLEVRSDALAELKRPEDSEAVLVRAAEGARAMGWLRRAASLCDEAGRSAGQRRAWDAARKCWAECLAVCERRDHKPSVAETLVNIGLAHWRLRDEAMALASYERAQAVFEALGDAARAAEEWARLGRVQHVDGQHEKARASYLRAQGLMERQGDKLGVARMHNSIGRAHQEQGDYDLAKTHFDRAQDERQDFKAKTGKEDKIGEALTLRNLGTVSHQVGDYATALTLLQSALEQMQALPNNEVGEAEVLSAFGNVYQALGDYDRALDSLKRAREKFQKSESKAQAADALAGIGSVHWFKAEYETDDVEASRAEYQLARDSYKAALLDFEALDNQVSAAATLGNLGLVEDSLGEFAAARATYERALEMKVAQGGDAAGVAMTRANLAEVHQHIGSASEDPDTRKEHFDRAEELLEESVRGADDKNAGPELVAALAMLARLKWEAGKLSDALRRAEAASKEIYKQLEHLGDELSAKAREQYATVYAIGALAAMELGSGKGAPDAFEYLESGRAGALREMLGQGKALRWKAQRRSEKWKGLDQQARAEQDAAHQAVNRANQRGDRKEIEAAVQEFDKKSDAVRWVAERIQRHQKQEADLRSVRAKPMKAVQRSLAADQALVLYGLFRDKKGLDDALALVLRREGARVMRLGKSSEIEAACRALAGGDAASGGTVGSSDPARGLLGVGRQEGGARAGADWANAVDRVKALLVRPLELEAEVRQVLVSPDGLLCYLPFGALFEQTVAMTPSGTTHVLLREQAREPGSEASREILALGDPDYSGRSEGAQAIYYRGHSLERLPATREEAVAIGTKTLLGKDASEAGLHRVLASAKRWRAVHFACHGLVNVERPMLSSLALSRSEGDEADGFLTALEVMDTEIPADLVALSACETSRGKIGKGEGILGFTRAFMFAGAPRVLCSLWPVDDAATAALMTKFYALWSPRDGTKGLGAAEALQKAQEFVRGQEKWKDPHFWAAWTLWGLPD